MHRETNMVRKSIDQTFRQKRVKTVLISNRPKGRAKLIAALQRQLAIVPVCCALPDVEQACIGHCGMWHVVTTIPLTVSCCGAVLLQER